MLPRAQQTHCPTHLQLQLFFLAIGGTPQKYRHAHFRHAPKMQLMLFFLGKATTPQNCCEIQQQLILVTKLELNKKNVAMLLASQNAAEGVSWET